MNVNNFNLNIKFLIEQVRRGNYALVDSVESTLNYLGAGLNWEALSTNGLPIVLFCENCFILNNYVISGTERDYHYSIIELESIARTLEILKKENPTIDDQATKKIIAKIKDRPNDVLASTIFTLILNNWDYLRDRQRTYRLLSAVLRMCDNFPNDLKSRKKFINILNEISL